MHAPDLITDLQAHVRRLELQLAEERRLNDALAYALSRAADLIDDKVDALTADSLRRHVNEWRARR